MSPEQPIEPNEPKSAPERHGKPRSTATGSKKLDTEPVPKPDLDKYSVLWERGRLANTMLALVIGMCLWAELFAFARGTFVGAVFIVPAVIATFVLAYLIIAVSRFGSTFDIAVALLFALSSSLAIFSVLYWNYGTTKNFTANLTQLDAIYFSVGTLSTAGTGNISAISQTARGLQTLQMILDIGLIVFAVSLAVTEISARIQRRS